MYSRRNFTKGLLATAAAQSFTTGGRGSWALAEQAPLISPRPAPRPNRFTDDTPPEIRRIIGELIITGFEGTDPLQESVKQARANIEHGYANGILLLGRNVKSLEQLRTLNGYLSDGNPGNQPLICIDNEGGAVTRTEGSDGFSPWLAAEAIERELPSNPERVRYYTDRAWELRSAGINWNLAPVVDLNTNRQSPVIGALGRSYAADPSIVSTIATDFVQAHRAAGVATALKHFPGHGSATGDSHNLLPDVSATWAATELQPYQDLIENGAADAIMVGHLYHPWLSDHPDWPTSLSKNCADLIRNGLSFKGVIVTDDLQMGAIRSRLDEASAAVAALQAGADILIFSTYRRPDPDIARRINSAIFSALRDGRLELADLLAKRSRVRALT